jgi:hypothetical protein
MTVQDWIQRNGLKPSDRDPRLWSGFYLRAMMGAGSEDVRWPEGGIWQDAWSNGFREVHIYPQDRAILTYCEGDLDATVDETEEAFQERVKSAAAFYEAPADLGVKQ